MTSAASSSSLSSAEQRAYAAAQQAPALTPIGMPWSIPNQEVRTLLCFRYSPETFIHLFQCLKSKGVFNIEADELKNASLEVLTRRISHSVELGQEQG